MNKVIFKLLLVISTFGVLPAGAQFAPQAGIAGSTAVSKNDGKLVAWANRCNLQRGFMHIEDKGLGMASIGDDTMAIGKADNYVVSLGDSGVATITFESPIYNGSGPDFAIFENGFTDPADPEMAFLELAFVEVSSDGSHFVRFPASSQTPAPQIPVAGVYMNARKINNLAGKYVSNFGTPFDLQELADSANLDVNHITHIRLVDVIGSIGTVGSRDKDGNVINDPYPSAVPGSGFDLDAVGVFYMQGKFPSAIQDPTQPVLTVFPNPVVEKLLVNTTGPLRLKVTDITGKVLIVADVQKELELSFSGFSAGIYYIVCDDSNGKKWAEKVIKL